MSSLTEVLTTSTLNEACRNDLLTHVIKLQVDNLQNEKKPVTVSDQSLPCAVYASTESRQKKIVAPESTCNNNSSASIFASKKETQKELMQSVIAAGNCKLCSINNNNNNNSSTIYDSEVDNTNKLITNYSENRKSNKMSDISCSNKVDSASCTTVKANPFVHSRHRNELSDKDIDFVHRYAEAMTHQTISESQDEDEEETSKAKLTAIEAYKKAFMQYKGRQPTPVELQEVNRLYFGFDEYGNVGVVQKPHSCYPHYHSSTRCVNHTCCPQQVYLPSQRPIRAARDRFPGPIPLKSSTKNTNMMVSLVDEPATGHQEVNTFAKKSTMLKTMTKSCEETSKYARESKKSQKNIYKFT